MRSTESESPRLARHAPIVPLISFKLDLFDPLVFGHGGKG